MQLGMACGSQPFPPGYSSVITITTVILLWRSHQPIYPTKQPTQVLSQALLSVLLVRSSLPWPLPTQSQCSTSPATASVPASLSANTSPCHTMHPTCTVTSSTGLHHACMHACTVAHAQCTWMRPHMDEPRARARDSCKQAWMAMCGTGAPHACSV